ncbi:MAG: C-terminal helicase domain-containing protein, partial [Bacteroidota bacterium]
FKSFSLDNPDLDLDEFQPNDIEDDELRDALEVGSKRKFNLAHLDVDAWLKDLRNDRSQLNLLYLSARDITADRDAKLQELKSLIQQKVNNPTHTKWGGENRKVLVFTAFADTAEYLYESLLDWATEDLKINIAMVSGGVKENRATFGRSEFNHILTNFSPVAKNRDKMKSMPQEGEIDLLIATDCISEGQNLQDCDYLINYDIHWNPVRLVQRFGRIDRIGSINTAVQMVNFWPTDDLNKYINLKNRVEARMALVDITATNQDNILNTDEIRELVTDDLNYRDRQLLRLKDEVLDLEDFNETVALSDFSLDDFRIELTKYIENNRQALENAPLGLYAVVPPNPEYARVVGPGVIFCLRQKGDTSGNETVNPLQPYFLVYIRNDGEVRYSFTHSKQILDIFRGLCAGKATPYESLCDLFDSETANGGNMKKYSALLDAAVNAISRSFGKRIASALTRDRGGKIPAESRQIGSATEFDLITWLVIR